MGDMAIGHQKIGIADHRGSAFFGTAVDGDKFPDFVVTADFGEGGFTFLVGDILRRVANDRVTMDFVMVAEFGAEAKVRARMDRVVGSDFDPIFHSHIGPNGIAGSHPDVFP